MKKVKRNLNSKEFKSIQATNPCDGLPVSLGLLVGMVVTVQFQLTAYLGSRLAELGKNRT